MICEQSDMENLNGLWHPWERENLDYFTLGDLWNCYDEWSAYGAGVPITIDDGQNLVQYFVPYLSAIQIFTSDSSVNCVREETDTISETRDFFSDSLSDESDSEKLYRWDGCSSEEGLFEHDNFWHPNDRLGNLYFQYFERNSPYERVPLMDKINSLAQRYPGLSSLRSVDLSPASWMAVAWYPIYHIPMRRTIKDLHTGFLTYHTISSSFQGMHLFRMNLDSFVFDIILIQASIMILQKWTLRMTRGGVLKVKERKENASLSLHLVWPLIKCKGMCGSRTRMVGIKRGWCLFWASQIPG
ncbi:Hypothetical predicted protein [Olea europaea subsp. europaea]|uniref:Uncharacterized protein n=1 Tax=Olea europaea subsp. europaea TaxID=158383 RepID=A0A8S0SSI1_OLEEU|nr:Hypothetical predicted protein [Olea europaea subsp. europaea]